MGRRTNVALGAIAGLLAVALAVSARRAGDGGGQAAIDRVAAELDARLREAAAEARSRAQTLADLPRLAVAVATDASTVRDLTGDELAFRPGPGETIEIAQVRRPRGPVMSLLRIPEDGGVDVPLATAGEFMVRRGDELRVAAVVTFEPRERADELFGVVAVSRVTDLARLMPLLAPVGGGVRLETSAGAFALGDPLPTGATTVTMPIGRGMSQDARLVAQAPAAGGWIGWRLAIAGALAAIGLVVLGRAARAGAAPARDVTAATPASPASAPALVGPPPRTRSPSMSGLKIGNYTVLDRLGRGGMADVYLARAEGEAGFERLVALKVMLDEFVANPKFVDHFLDEARLAPRLNHPNIVAITDLGRAGEKYVIAMEYVDGADLERLVRSVAARGAEIPVRIALAIVRRVCDGLHYAHTATDGDGAPLDLVHRDVKSANVFVAKNGTVKVGDFGIAKIAGSMRTAKTEIGEVKGTAAYMAPEHRLGRAIDARADVYAVGAICYELLTGKEINLDLAMLAHLGKEGWPHLPPLGAMRAGLPPELDAVVFRAMAYERDDRYPSCEAFEAALADLVDRHGLAASDKAIAQWIQDELPRLPGLPRSALDLVAAHPA